MPKASYRIASFAVLSTIATFISMAAFGCRSNPNYCAGANPNNNCSEIDAPIATCSGSTECSGSTPVCNLSGGAGKGTCVQCTTSEAASCMGATPVCSSDNTCRGCTAHSECASNACLPSGACAVGTDVAYVAPTGTGPDCTQKVPCSNVTLALARNRPYVKMSGTINDSPTIKGTQEVTILSEPGAKLTNSGIIVRVDESARVSIYDLEISGSTGGSGISLQPGNAATVSLNRVKLINNQDGGINLSGGTLNIIQSTLSGNPGGGVTASGGGTLNIIQSTLSGNPGGGVTASGGGTLNIMRSEISKNADGGIIMNSPTTFQIVNNFIVGNGTLSSDVGGIKANPSAGVASKLEFNTIVGNLVDTNAAAVAGGVFCDQPSFTYNNNILYQNGLTQKIGRCGSGNSYVQNDATTLNFRSSTDFHLTAATPTPSILDSVDCAGNAEDYDGDPRPQGRKCDLGADEYRP